MGTLTTNIFATTDENGVVGTWVGMIAYTFQIYFDFRATPIWLAVLAI